MNKLQLFLFVALMASCRQDDPARTDEYSRMASDGSLIAERQMSATIARGEKGDLNEIHKLIRHHIATGGSSEEVIYWTNKAAYLGDANAMLDLAGYYLESGGTENCLKAQDLVVRASNKTESDRVIKRVSRFNSLLESCSIK